MNTVTVLCAGIVGFVLGWLATVISVRVCVRSGLTIQVKKIEGGDEGKDEADWWKDSS